MISNAERERIRADLVTPPGPWPREQQLHRYCWQLLADGVCHRERIAELERELVHIRALIAAGKMEDE